MKPHGERAHSKFSASGSERWINCPGSVELSEGVPDKDSVWSLEGTRAHEVLEDVMRKAMDAGSTRVLSAVPAGTLTFGYNVAEMYRHAFSAANFILGLHAKAPRSELLVETRIYLDFIHPEMFGTFDGAIVDHFGTLHVIDFKYGAGHAVSPVKNLQMIFYGVGLAAKYDWNFKNARLWIIQPRIKGYDGPTFWDLNILELKQYVSVFKQAVKEIEDNPGLYREGSWCHWCKAKPKCPLKQGAKLEQAISVFSKSPLKKGR